MVTNVCLTPSFVFNIVIQSAILTQDTVLKRHEGEQINNFFFLYSLFSKAIFVHVMCHPLNVKYLKGLINKITSAN